VLLDEWKKTGSVSQLNLGPFGTYAAVVAEAAAKAVVRRRRSMVVPAARLGLWVSQGLVLVLVSQGWVLGTRI
jgi:hypothetical protein